MDIKREYVYKTIIRVEQNGAKWGGVGRYITPHASVKHKIFYPISVYIA
jgi:hypothetical protein